MPKDWQDDRDDIDRDDELGFGDDDNIDEGDEIVYDYSDLEDSDDDEDVWASAATPAEEDDDDDDDSIAANASGADISPCYEEVHTLVSEVCDANGKPLLAQPGAMVLLNENLYVSSQAHLVKIGIHTGEVTSLCGEGTASNEDNGATASERDALRPQQAMGLAVDNLEQFIFVADAKAHSVLMLELSTGGISMLAGGDGKGYVDGVGEHAQFNVPTGLAFDSVRNCLYVADSGNNCIREIDIFTRKVSTLAGSGDCKSSDGVGTKADFAIPHGLAILPTCKALLVTESKGHKIREIDLSNRKTRTICGSESAGFADGSGRSAAFNSPLGICLDASGRRAFVADGTNNRVRAITLESGMVSTFAGNGSEGSTDGNARVAELSNPTCTATSSFGIVYVCDRSITAPIREVSRPLDKVASVNAHNQTPSWKVRMDEDAQNGAYTASVKYSMADSTHAKAVKYPMNDPAEQSMIQGILRASVEVQKSTGAPRLIQHHTWVAVDVSQQVSGDIAGLQDGLKKMLKVAFGCKTTSSVHLAKFDSWFIPLEINKKNFASVIAKEIVPSQSEAANVRRASDAMLTFLEQCNDLPPEADHVVSVVILSNSAVAGHNAAWFKSARNVVNNLARCNIHVQCHTVDLSSADGKSLSDLANLSVNRRHALRAVLSPAAAGKNPNKGPKTAELKTVFRNLGDLITTDTSSVGVCVRPVGSDSHVLNFSVSLQRLKGKGVSADTTQGCSSVSILGDAETLKAIWEGSASRDVTLASNSCSINGATFDASVISESSEVFELQSRGWIEAMWAFAMQDNDELEFHNRSSQALAELRSQGSGAGHPQTMQYLEQIQELAKHTSRDQASNIYLLETALQAAVCGGAFALSYPHVLTKFRSLNSAALKREEAQRRQAKHRAEQERQAARDAAAAQLRKEKDEKRKAAEEEARAEEERKARMVLPPKISAAEDGTFEIMVTKGTQINYTLNGETPPGGQATDAEHVMSSEWVAKTSVLVPPPGVQKCTCVAVAWRYHQSDMVVSEVATLEVDLEQTPAPTVQYDNVTSKVTVTTADDRQVEWFIGSSKPGADDWKSYDGPLQIDQSGTFWARSVAPWSASSEVSTYELRRAPNPTLEPSKMNGDMPTHVNIFDTDADFSKSTVFYSWQSPAVPNGKGTYKCTKNEMPIDTKRPGKVTLHTLVRADGMLDCVSSKSFTVREVSEPNWVKTHEVVKVKAPEGVDVFYSWIEPKRRKQVQAKKPVFFACKSKVIELSKAKANVTGIGIVCKCPGYASNKQIVPVTIERAEKPKVKVEKIMPSKDPNEITFGKFRVTLKHASERAEIRYTLTKGAYTSNGSERGIKWESKGKPVQYTGPFEVATLENVVQLRAFARNWNVAHPSLAAGVLLRPLIARPPPPPVSKNAEIDTPIVTVDDKNGKKSKSAKSKRKKKAPS